MSFSPSTVKEHEILAKAIQQQRVILFTGAGFSCEATNANNKTLGTGKDLKETLAIQFLPEYNKDDIIVYQLDELCEFILEYKKFDPKDMNNPLNVFLRSYYSNCTPQSYHYIFNKFRWRRIFTTNIDDVMEKVFKRSDEHYLRIHNSSIKQKPDDPRLIAYYKLHGCVNNPDEPFIFTIKEYVKQMARGDFRYDVFANDFGTEIFLFVGTALNERNLELFLEKKQRHNLGKRENEVFIVTTDKDPLRQMMLKTKYGAVIISATTETFASSLNEWCGGEYIKDPPPIEDEFIIDGFIDVRRSISKKEDYPSKFNCFLGYPMTWAEAKVGAYVHRNQVTNLVDSAIKLQQNGGSGLFVVTGKIGCGKSTALKMLSLEILNKCNQYILEWSSTDDLPVDDIFAFIARNTKNTFVTLLIDNAAIHYHHIGQLLKSLNDANIHGWLVFLAERVRGHNQNKHLIKEYLFQERICSLNTLNAGEKIKLCRILEEFKVGDPAIINRIKTNSTSNGGRIGDISALLYTATNSSVFEDSLQKNISAISKSNKNKWHFLLGVAILDQLDCRKVPSVILDEWIDRPIAEMCERFEDILLFKQVRSNLVTISTINSHYTNKIIDMATFDEMIEVIESICIPLISQLEDRKHDTYRMIIEFLLRFSSIRDLLRINSPTDIRLERISSMYEKLGKYTNHFSFILVQWALLSQYRGDFLTAEFRLKRAKKISARSYQVSHAYGNNCLKWAVISDNRNDAIRLFNQGMDIMANDILDSEEAQGDEFALHSLGIRAIKLYTLHPDWDIPTTSQLNDILHRIDVKIRSGINTRHIRDLIRQFQEILPKIRKMQGTTTLKELTVPFHMMNQAMVEAKIEGDWDEQEEI